LTAEGFRAEDGGDTRKQASKQATETCRVAGAGLGGHSHRSETAQIDTRLRDCGSVVAVVTRGYWW
jgi:hypothetical protein